MDIDFKNSFDILVINAQVEMTKQIIPSQMEDGGVASPPLLLIIVMSSSNQRF